MLALGVVLISISRAETERCIALVSAGSLEDLTASHGDQVIDRIEHETKTSKRMRYALSGLWPQGHADTPVWARIMTARAFGPDMDRGKSPF